MSEPLSLPLPPDFVEQVAQRVAEILRDEIGNGSPWLDRPAAARYLSLPVSRLEKDKSIPVHKDGGRCLYHRDELDAYLSSKLDNPSPSV